MANDERHLGIVKFYNPRKGYGFITRPEDGTDVFFHLTHFRTLTTPAPGNVVRFAIGQNREGVTAEDIVVVPADEVECFSGTITRLSDDGGVATTHDNFEIHFLRADFIPHTRADSLRVGDEVEMQFLRQDDEGEYHAKIIHEPDFDPDSAMRAERREGDEEEENRRLLGILYKTDLDQEALHAAGLLAERNMRASLSAVVSRIYDQRLSFETRLELVRLVPEIYFDDECQRFLDEMAARLRRSVEDQDAARDGGAANEILGLMLDDETFPVRWSQYLLPFGLTLLRSLGEQPACANRLAEEATEDAAERWLLRVCRHVEQRRSGHGYVLTTTLNTFDELWRRELLRRPVRRITSRLLIALDGEGLAAQIYHLRDRLSPEFLQVLLPLLGQHPDLGAAIRQPAQGEIFCHWVEQLVRQAGEELPTELLAVVLPLVEDLRSAAVDDDAVQRLLGPITENLSSAEIVRMLTSEDLPERAVWACLRHLDQTGELNQLLSEPAIRKQVTAWLQRTSQQRHQPGLEREQEVSTALKLIDSLRQSGELRSELAGIGQSLFSGIHQRLAEATGDELVNLLDGLDVSQLPGLTRVLGGRLCQSDLSDVARQRIVAHISDLGVAHGDLARALVAWVRQPDGMAQLSELIGLLEPAEESDDPELQALATLAAERLEASDLSWHDGFVMALEEMPIGGQAARLDGFAILVPKRLFADPADFAPNRYVRLIHRRGRALGVVRADAPETGYVCGRLDGPLMIDERDAMCGILRDPDGEVCYFEVSEMRDGLDQPLEEGDLLRFTRTPAVGNQPYRYVAFNVHATFGPAEAELLLATFVSASDVQVAVAALTVALECSEQASLTAAWAEASAERRLAAREQLPDELRQRLDAVAGGGAG